jgi:hypothetical protein
MEQMGFVFEELAGGGAPTHTAAADAAPAHVAAADGALAAGAVGGGGQQPRQAMRWTAVMSSFVLQRFCHLIATGVRTDKGFKEVHLNQVARDLHEFTGNDVTGT